jgi:hypothetical protein
MKTTIQITGDDKILIEDLRTMISHELGYKISLRVALMLAVKEKLGTK